jgi:very-short-patch-repair endonuclease
MRLRGDKSRARKLRRKMSLPEVLLWQQLRNEPEGVQFRRQHPAGPYVLDFFCATANVAVEIDGEAHNSRDRPERDLRRDSWLSDRGVRVLRIPAVEVLKNLDGVLQAISAAVHAE